MKQRVVIAEDDPISAEFLRGALARFGEVQHRAGAEGLFPLVAQEDTALLVLDDRLGATRAGELLPALRRQLGDSLPILLVSAELPETLAAQRIAEGASACLAKPMSLASLLACVAQIAPGLHSPWDEAQALHSLGPDPDARNTLRKLLLDELPGVRSRVRAALENDHPAALRDELHRLRAACGFCGANALAATVDGLARHRRGPQLQAFESACEALMGVADEPCGTPPPASPDNSSSRPQQRSGRVPSS